MYLRKQYIKYILLQNENYFIDIINIPMTLSLYKYEYNNLIEINNKFIMLDNRI